MNKCDNYKIPCPLALSEDAKDSGMAPCVGSQKQCNCWRAKYRKAHPKKYQQGLRARNEELGFNFHETR